MAFFTLVGPNEGKDGVFCGIQFEKGVAEVADDAANRVENMLVNHYSCKRSDSKPSAVKKVAERVAAKVTKDTK